MKLLQNFHLAVIEHLYRGRRVVPVQTYFLSCTVSRIWPPKTHKSLYLATPFAFNPPPKEGVRDDLRKILTECQRMAKVPNGKETLPKISTG